MRILWVIDNSAVRHSFLLEICNRTTRTRIVFVGIGSCIVDYLYPYWLLNLQ
jgi:hypothetical protein